jgi:hypothetical protein
MDLVPKVDHESLLSFRGCLGYAFGLNRTPGQKHSARYSLRPCCGIDVEARRARKYLKEAFPYISTEGAVAWSTDACTPSSGTSELGIPEV